MSLYGLHLHIYGRILCFKVFCVYHVIPQGILKIMVPYLITEYPKILHTAWPPPPPPPLRPRSVPPHPQVNHRSPTQTAEPTPGNTAECSYMYTWNDAYNVRTVYVPCTYHVQPCTTYCTYMYNILYIYMYDYTVHQHWSALYIFKSTPKILITWEPISIIGIHNEYTCTLGLCLTEFHEF